MSRRRLGRRGWGALLLIAVLGAVWLGIYPFLAPNRPVAADGLVIEGWVGDEQLLAALNWAEVHGVKNIYATGGPIEMGAWLSEWNSYAEMTLARLNKLEEAKKFELAAFPARKVRRDRTRESARALKTGLGAGTGALNVASEGPHTRRSWRAFRKVMGREVQVGCVALTPTSYDGRDWWVCSEGVRAVVGETVAYLYDLLPRKRGEAEE